MEIHNKNNIAIISDEYPAIITAWSVNGIDILLPEQNVLINGQNKKRGGIPICFPNFGKPVLYDDVEIPQHGFLRSIKNVLTPTGINQSRIFFDGNASAYGLSYDVSSFIQVQNGQMSTLSQNLIVKSGSDFKKMPLCLGFHPYFRVNRKYLKFVLDDIAMNMISDKNLIKAQMFDFKSHIEIQLDENLFVEITCSVDFDTGHQKICIWSDNPDKYICVEPIIHNPKLFGTPQGYFVDDTAKYFDILYVCKML